MARAVIIRPIDPILIEVPLLVTHFTPRVQKRPLELPELANHVLNGIVHNSKRHILAFHVHVSADSMTLLAAAAPQTRAAVSAPDFT